MVRSNKVGGGRGSNTFMNWIPKSVAETQKRLPGVDKVKQSKENPPGEASDNDAADEHPLGSNGSSPGCPKRSWEQRWVTMHRVPDRCMGR